LDRGGKLTATEARDPGSLGPKLIADLERAQLAIELERPAALD
jgi:hypothetical protein